MARKPADTAELMQIHESLIAERDCGKSEERTACDKPDNHGHNIGATSSGVVNSSKLECRKGGHCVAKELMLDS